MACPMMCQMLKHTSVYTTDLSGAEEVQANVSICSPTAQLAGASGAGSIGIVHVLRALRGRRDEVALQQQEDIAAVGPLMVRLAGGAAGAPTLQALAGHLSPHLLHLLASLQNGHTRDCHTVRVYSHAVQLSMVQM